MAPRPRRRWRAATRSGLVGQLVAIPLAGLLALLGAHDPRAALLVVAVPAVVTLIVLRPAAISLTVLLLAQELQPAAVHARGSWLLTSGSAVYLQPVAKFSPMLLVLALAAFSSLVWGRRAGLRFPVWPLLLLTAAGLAVGTVCLFYGVGLLAAANQYGRPFMLATFSYLVGATVPAQPGGWRTVSRCAGAAVVLLALAGVLLAVAGAGIDLSGHPILIFYDSALPAAAGALLLALLLRPDARHRALTLAALVIVLLSFRRNVWVAMLVALIIAVAVSVQGRTRLLARLGGGLCILVALVAVAAPGVLASATARLFEGLAGLSDNGTADSSTLGHADDIRYGWMYAQQHLWLGVGPNHAPLPGMYVQEGTLYVHNDVLLSWLRYGVCGLLALVLPLGTFAAVSLRRLRSRAPGLPTSVAALFLLLAPVCGLSAAFFVTTERWPALIGLAIGATAGHRTVGSARAPDLPASSEPALLDAGPAQTVKKQPDLAESTVTEPLFSFDRSGLRQ